jgi:hypothetical protein
MVVGTTNRIESEAATRLWRRMTEVYAADAHGVLVIDTDFLGEVEAA